MSMYVCDNCSHYKDSDFLGYNVLGVMAVCDDCYDDIKGEEDEKQTNNGRLQAGKVHFIPISEIAPRYRSKTNCDSG